MAVRNARDCQRRSDLQGFRLIREPPARTVVGHTRFRASLKFRLSSAKHCQDSAVHTYTGAPMSAAKQCMDIAPHLIWRIDARATAVSARARPIAEKTARRIRSKVEINSGAMALRATAISGECTAIAVKALAGFSLVRSTSRKAQIPKSFSSKHSHRGILRSSGANDTDPKSPRQWNRHITW